MAKTPSSTPKKTSQPRLLQTNLANSIDLLTKGQVNEAHNILAQLNQQYPNNAQVMRGLIDVNVRLGNNFAVAYYCDLLGKVQSDDALILFNYALASQMVGNYAHAIKGYQKLIKRWPEHEKAEFARQQLAELDKLYQEVLDRITGIAENEKLLWSEQSERIYLLTSLGKTREGIRLAEGLLKRFPQTAEVLNNLSYLVWLEGQSDRAIALANQVLSLDANNFQAQTNLCKFLFLNGAEQAAKEVAAALKQNDQPSFQREVKLMQAFALLQDFSGVLATYEVLKSKPGENPVGIDEPIALHLAAVATIAQGKEEEAIALWNKAIEAYPYYAIARENLQDLRQPVGTRNGAWAFDPAFYLPVKIADEIMRLFHGFQQKSTRPRIIPGFGVLLQRYPQLKPTLKILLNQGSDDLRDFALNTIAHLEDLDLFNAARDFAAGQKGSDQRRLQAVNIAIEGSVLQSGANEVWMNGIHTRVIVLNHRIEQKKPIEHTASVAKKFSQAIKELQADKLDKAEALLNQALEIEPDQPDLLNNLAYCYIQQGKTAEGIALFERIIAEYGDYTISPINLARICIQDGQLLKANALLEPLVAARSFQPADYELFCGAEIELHLAFKDMTRARIWQQMLEKALPDSPAVPFYLNTIQRAEKASQPEDSSVMMLTKTSGLHPVSA